MASEEVPSEEEVPVDLGKSMKYGYPEARRPRSGRRGWIILAVLAVVFIGGGMYACSGYNKAVTLDEDVKKQWAQVENQLKRRHDLIPNLVQVVKGYAKHEKEVFENVANARKGYANAGSVSDKARAAGELERALSRLLMIVENYPQLKANQNFLKLQDELAGTENRIAVARKRYNESVKAVNAYRRKFPSSIFAGWADVQEANYFEVPKEEQDVPKVDFDG